MKNVALHLAAAKTQHRLMRILLEGGCDVNEKSYDGKTPLMVACSLNVDYDGKEMNEGTRLLMVQLLLKHKADVNCRDINGRTALLWAFKTNAGTAVGKLLLENGADPTVSDFKNKTPLYYLKRLDNPAYDELLHHFPRESAILLDVIPIMTKSASCDVMDSPNRLLPPKMPKPKGGFIQQSRSTGDLQKSSKPQSRHRNNVSSESDVDEKCSKSTENVRLDGRKCNDKPLPVSCRKQLRSINSRMNIDDAVFLSASESQESNIDEEVSNITEGQFDQKQDPSFPSHVNSNFFRRRSCSEPGFYWKKIKERGKNKPLPPINQKKIMNSSDESLGSLTNIGTKYSPLPPIERSS